MKPGRIYPSHVPENRVYQGSSGAVYPLRRDRYAERAETLKSWQAVWLENDYIKVMILPELGGGASRVG